MAEPLTLVTHWLPGYELVKRDFPLRRNVNWTEMDKTGHFWGKVGSRGNE